MRYRLIKAIGYTLMGVAFVSTCLGAVAALRAGRQFTGLNVYGLPIGAVTVLIVFAVAAMVGVYRVVRFVAARLDSDRSS